MLWGWEGVVGFFYGEWGLASELISDVCVIMASEAHRE